ncbi:MAG: bacteriorhodopsin [Nitriliruptoraceae bacterium]|nr:bacteriorhodopsin [Nitriliruptoraceae bacterium]
MDVTLLELTPFQSDLVGGFFSLTFAVFLGSALFFFLGRREVAPRYRMAVTISGVIVTIAAYHYWRILGSFEAASMGESLFNEAYRYVDWIITVPLLLTELVLVLSIDPARRRSLLQRLVPYSFLMIALGFPGEVAATTSTAVIFWALSMVFFVLILVTLFGELSRQIAAEPPAVQSTLRALRVVLLVTWSFYPIAYLFPLLLADAATAFVLLNVGYAVADITAKAGYGLLIHHVATVKTELDEAVIVG